MLSLTMPCTVMNRWWRPDSGAGATSAIYIRSEVLYNDSMDTARMISKAHRPQGCQFGCCVPDFPGARPSLRTKAARRAIKRATRRVEARQDARDAR